MFPRDESWRTDDARALFEALLLLETPDEVARLMRDLCTVGELRDLAQRWAVVRLLDQGLHYAEIGQRTGASTATITRIAAWLRHGEGGYRLLLDRVKAPPATRQRRPGARRAR
ncbi:MAG TPA: YerC/YecD family TrpR-related protein [Candidatus Limnocylindrales bacterium]|nr:YerC/YecD family TrpR-related protein [Candidatus Limnocylindrales bacterium]